MNPAKWQKLEEIYDQALALKPDDRESFCVRACGNDSEVLAELQKMFNGHARAIENSFLDHAAWRINPANLKEDEMIGKVIGNIYKITEKIGEGGMGEVYLAVGIAGKREEGKYVVKLASKYHTDEEKQLFLKEVIALNKLKHENIAAIYYWGEVEDGRPYYVMEYIEGSNLRKYIIDNRIDNNGLELELVNRITTLACAGLQHAHDKGVIHRDLKPQNIMITEEDGILKVKVIDFGIAKLIESITHKATAHFMGTPGYASPEQRDINHLHNVDRRTDIFSMGLVVNDMLTGRFADQSTPKISPQVDRVVMRALSRKPAERQQSIKELADELNAAIKGEQEIVNSVEPPPRPKPNPPRRGFMIAAIVMIAAVMLASPYLRGIIKEKTGEPPSTPSIAASLPTIEPPKMDIYQRGAANGPGEIVKDKVFTSDDKLRFTVAPPADGYIYLVQRGSREDLTLIYPDSQIKNTDNSVRGGMPVLFPPAGTSGKPVWFNFDNKPGVETVYGVFVKDKSDKIAGAIEEGIRRNRRSPPPLNQLLLDEGIEVLLQNEIEKPSSNSVSVSKLVFNHK